MLAVLGVAWPALAGCEAASSDSADAATTSMGTVAGPSTAASTPSPTGAPPRPTTEPPTTTEPPPPTEPSTTTTAPATTAAPPTTLPRNFVPVEPVPQPLAAVGTSSGAETERIQLRLLELGFWLGGVDGQYGLTTKQAVMAFQKYVGLNPTGSVDRDTAAFLTAITERARARADSGTIVEVDKGRQLLFIVHNGATLWVLNTSTGSEIPYEEVNKKDPSKIERGDSVTDNGLFRVNRERPEGWWEGDLGQIYRPKYFNGGIAVHGSNSVPNYPASHGCVRVSVPAMDFIWEQDLMPRGIPVWVHEGT
jgi:peptidoglycan hydrolase-like protein with peptidoglycan-binding domain